MAEFLAHMKFDGSHVNIGYVTYDNIGAQFLVFLGIQI